MSEDDETWEEDDSWEPISGWPTIEVEITPRQVIGELLGPDGEPILTFYDRGSVPFGFQRSVRSPS